MVFLVSLLIGTQVLCSLAGHPPQRESPPPPPPPPPPPHRLMSPPCNSSSVKMAAELALDKLNEHRREGYVLGLQRIFDAHELEWQETGSLFYLTLDVMETDCHELSRKSWKDCQFRQAHESVYGQCKATFYINRPWRILHLFNYDCVLRHVPAAVIAKMCPDCPTPKDPTEPECLEAATQSLAKFNAESNHTHYFKVHNVTRASYQWVVGPSNFVDYVIQETSCPKSQPLDDLSKCPFLPDETADVGVCKGSVIDSQIEHQKFVTASCEVFHPQVKGGEQAGKRKPGHHDDDESREDDGENTVMVILREEGENTVMVILREEGENTVMVILREEGENTMMVILREERENTVMVILREEGENTMMVILREEGENTVMVILREEGENTRMVILREEGEDTGMVILGEEGEDTMMVILREEGEDTGMVILGEEGEEIWERQWAG
ncbi:UNVERIFIED_CONTAM: hypothetical protein K2H54_061224 [Gekko kuhli]